MAKTNEELNQLKKDYEELNNKLKSLSEEELKYVAAGVTFETSEYNPSYEQKFYHNGIENFDK